MFTGITEQTGRIASIEHGPKSGRLRIEFGRADNDSAGIAGAIKLGDSIMVNGCCLTAIEFDGGHFSADLSGETLARTSFGEKRVGDVVNLERPLAAGARLGGHFVQGHVDGVGRVVGLAPEGENWWLSVRIPENLRRYVVEKGSVAFDGISLTVARWQDGVASIAVIPFTYSHTNVQSMTPGTAVNVEVDILSKYVESILRNRDTSADSHLTVAQLTDQGF